MKTIVTKAGLEILKARLAEKIAQLKSLRDEKSHAYSASGDGWHDNPGWIQLGQQEEMIASEVSFLQQKINTVSIVDTANADVTRIQIGCKVAFAVFKQRGGPSVMQTVYIVGNGETDIKNKRITYDSPMGKALYQMQKGEEKEVILPTGNVHIKIEGICYE